MASFIPTKKVANDFNKGVAYQAGDIVQAETINNVIECALYSEEVAAQSTIIADSALTVANEALDKVVDATSGLFEIPYDLTDLESNSEGVDFIINNIEQIKKGAYFGGGANHTMLDFVSASTGSIAISFWSNTMSGGDTLYRYYLTINTSTKICDIYVDRFDGADTEDVPQLMLGMRDGNSVTISSAWDTAATTENDGKVIGIKGGQFVAMNAGAGFGIYDVTLCDDITRQDIVVYIRIPMTDTPHSVAEFIKFANLANNFFYSAQVYDGNEGYQAPGSINVFNNQVFCSADMIFTNGDSIAVNNIRLYDIVNVQKVM